MHNLNSTIYHGKIQYCLVFKTWYIHIQYWCIDGKYRIDVARLRNGGETNF